MCVGLGWVDLDMLYEINEVDWELRGVLWGIIYMDVIV